MANPVEEFLQMKKEAGFLDALKGAFGAFKKGVAGGRPNIPLSQSLPEVAGGIIPMALIGGAVAAGATGASKGIGMLRERFSKAKDYKNMLAVHPALGQYEAGEVQALYNSLRSMSPTMAKDPLISGSFIRESLAKRPEEGPAVSPLTAKMLAETERNVAQSGPHNRVLDAFRVGSMVPTHPDVMQQQRMAQLDQQYQNNLKIRGYEDYERGDQ